MSPRQAGDADFPDLLAEARRGNATALGVLLERRRNHLSQLVRHRMAADLQPKADGCDLVQDTFATAVRQFEKFQGDSGEEFVAWLRGILRNIFRHFVRDLRSRGKRHVARETSLDSDPGAAATAVALPCPEPSPAEKVLEWERCQTLHEALDALSREDRQLVCTRLWDGRGWEDVGDVLGISADAARHRWSSVLQRLSEDLPSEILDECATSAHCSRQRQATAGFSFSLRTC